MKIPKSVRVEEELLDWFEEQFTWTGALPFFVNEVLRELKESHGDRLPPREAAALVAGKLKRKF